MLSDTLKKNIIFINQARVTACFFIAQEMAQYRAEAHDMEVSEMEMKQVYEALEKVENGADLIAAIKGEINTLNNEAKKHRRIIDYNRYQQSNQRQSNDQNTLRI